MATLVSGLPSGGYVTITHGTNAHMPRETTPWSTRRARTRVPFQLRTWAEFAGFLEGTDPVLPGIRSVAEWRADDEVQPRPTAAETAVYGAVAKIR